MDTIFKYIDYQKYLRDFYEEKKKQSFFFSYRYMGNKTGLDPGFLYKVLQSKVHMAVKSISRVADFCELRGKEKEYFDVLVRYGRATAANDIKFYFEKLTALRGTDAVVLEETHYEFYQKWYYSAIHALLLIFPFTGNYRELARTLNPSISVKQAKEAIALLLKLGLITRNSDGRFEPTSKYISSGDKWKSAAVHSFQKETIRLAGEALDRVPSEMRDVSTVTVAVSHKDLANIREKAEAFRNAVLQLKTGNTPADIVYQVNIQILPLSEILGGKEQ